MILNNLKKIEKKIMKIVFFCLFQIDWNGRLTHKKHMLPFSPDVKMIPAYFFFSFQGFSERISCDPNPDSWSLNRRNEIVCIAHLLFYKIMIYSFLSFPFWPDPDPHFFCGSGSETLFLPWGCPIPGSGETASTHREGLIMKGRKSNQESDANGIADGHGNL